MKLDLTETTYIKQLFVILFKANLGSSMRYQIYFSALFSLFFSSLISNNKDILNLFVNVFSILSGFLFLVITMTGDISIPTEDKNIPELLKQNKEFHKKYDRLSLLFVSYLIVILLIMLLFLLNEHKVIGKFTLFGLVGQINLLIQYLVVFLITICFIKSFSLPWSLKRLYEKKIESFFKKP